MPLFDFKCGFCQQTVEVLAKDVHAADKEAPHCDCSMSRDLRQPRMTRLISRANVRPDYLDLEYAGTRQYADARSKQCGVGSL